MFRHLRIRPVIQLFLIFSFSLHLGPVLLDKQWLYAQPTGPTQTPAALLWSIDFQNLQKDPEEDLQEIGFSFEKDMDDQDDIVLSGDNGRLEINTLKPAFGLMVYKNLNLEQVNTIEIEWGVNRYPHGADWNNGLNREPVMICLFFGQPVDADRFYLPDSPYFIGVFLGENNRQMEPYIGNTYTKTARYVCLDAPSPGETVISRFNFSNAFREWFGKKEVPPVTGIAVEVDTTDLPDGISSAFIKKISLSRGD